MPYGCVTLPLGVALGVWLVSRHRSTRDRPRGRRILLGVVVGLGVGVLVNAAVEVAGVGDRPGPAAPPPADRRATAAEAEAFVRGQMEGQAGRAVDALHLRDRPGGGYAGEARVGGATYDVTVDVRGMEMTWQAVKRPAGGP